MDSFSNPPKGDLMQQGARSGIAYLWRGEFENAEVEALHAQAFSHLMRNHNWKAQLEQHSLGWVCARNVDKLVGFLNVLSGGHAHAFIVDVIVAPGARRRGIGTKLVGIATESARTAGCTW